MERRHNLTGWAVSLHRSASDLLDQLLSDDPGVYSVTEKRPGRQSEIRRVFQTMLRILKDPTFKGTLFNTFFYLIIQVPIMLTLALILASILNNKDLQMQGTLANLYFPSVCDFSGILLHDFPFPVCQ